MQNHEVDNFTQIVKHEVILNDYKDNELQLVLYGYFFQDLLIDVNELHFKFNLISDFILSRFTEILKVKHEDISKKKRTIIIKNLQNNQNYKRFVLKIDNFIAKIKSKQISKAMLWCFIIGWFLKSGSVSNLTSRFYHLEIKLKAMEFFNVLTTTLKHYKLPFKYLIRKKFIVFYIKKIDLISDFLKQIKAQNSMMKLEDERIKKDSNNYIQRWENLDISNTLKINTSSQRQIIIIKELKKQGIFDSLDDKTKLICALRLKYKELSLHDLALKINEYVKQENFVSKSSIAYSLKKIEKYLK